MARSKLGKLFKHLWNGAVDNGPTILTVCGIVGVVSTTVYVAKAAPKVKERLEERKEELEVEKLQPYDIFRTAFPYYAPAVALGGTSIACFICANSINLKRNAAIAGAYSLSEHTLREYQEKVIEKIGEKEEAKIQESIAEDRYRKDSASSNMTIVITGQGDYLCYEPMSKTYFLSDVEKIRQAKNNFNEQLLDEMYMSLNDWLIYQLNLDPVPWGDYLGWNVNGGGLMDFVFDYSSDENGRPCASIRYIVGPKDNYKY